MFVREVKMQTIELDVEGMSCNHCVMTVTKAIRSVPGVKALDVRVGHAHVEAEDGTARQQLVSAIEQEGFKVVTP